MMGCSGLVALALLAVSVSGYSGPDLPPGPYCSAPGVRCCNGREDGCSAPILGTLCYCDEFCDQNGTRDDCCPDFLTVCRGEEPELEPVTTVTCYHKGITISQFEKKIQDNCNFCECLKVNNASQLDCSADPCLIEEEVINNVNEDPASTWIAANFTPFWGHKLDEGIKLRLGTLTPQRFVLKMNPLRPVYDPTRLPRAFNSLDTWPDQLSPIQDQGWCGSSWAISTAAVASDKFAIMSNYTERPMLSAQQLMSCNSRGQQSCHGGHLDRAWLFIRKFGLVDENCYPYTAKDENCKINRKGTLESSGCALPGNGRVGRYHTSPAHRLGNETDIMHEIMISGPVQATMKVYQDFFVYNGGIYQHSRYVIPDKFGYHSVRIVGWGIEEGIKYWLAANSWGENWGEDGYFRIIRGINECEIETFVLGTWANTPEKNNNRVRI